MRGKVKATPPHTHEPRITPAYAGKRRRCFPCHKAKEDHPRLCGEKSSVTKNPTGDLGSPPPMRGKGYSICRRGTGRRITPAYAGKRQVQCRSHPILQDHPRLCGEKQEHIGNILTL